MRTISQDSCTQSIHNVLYISHQKNFLGGAERSLYEILKNIDKSRITPFYASSEDGELASAIKELGIPFLKLHKFEIKNLITVIITTMQLVNFIKKKNINIIHNNQCIDARSSFLAGKITHVPIIIHHRDSKLYKPDQILIKNVECNISISNWLNQELLGNKATVIHNGIEVEKYKNLTEASGNKKGIIEVGLIGRISPIKGQDIFIKAAKLVLEKNKNFHFKIIGDIDNSYYKEYKSGLLSLVTDYQLNDNLEFSGYTEDVIGTLRNIDISVIPSLREPFGRVIVESMACCKPVIATNVGGSLDIITDKTGILVPVNNPGALANAILFLGINPDLRRQMGNAGRDRALKCFSLDQTLSKIYMIYDHLD